MNYDRKIPIIRMLENNASLNQEKKVAEFVSKLIFNNIALELSNGTLIPGKRIKRESPGSV
ncbi:MAG: hypothetical protein RIC06_04135 [Cyclobacteriaceae bacterium]